VEVAVSAPILVTGADGFIGRALREWWRERGVRFSGVVREIAADAAHPEELMAAGVGAKADWGAALQGVETVVHLAGRVHVMREQAHDPEADYREANVELTRRLASAAWSAGVRRIVFASSAKVNGEAAPADRPFTEDDAPAPQDAYGRSKLAAEQDLRSSAASAGREAVILRLPLVYGPGVKGNFAALLAWLAAGRAIPVGAVRNRRSMLCVANACAAIDSAVRHPAAANRTFVVCDDEAVSTPELCRKLADALGVPARLPAVPLPLLRLAATLAGRGDALEKLTGSLVIDNARIKRELGWKPPVSADRGLAETAQAWQRHHPSSKKPEA
jgi:nucleoside-diphosphate-sugar epimerase